MGLLSVFPATELGGLEELPEWSGGGSGSGRARRAAPAAGYLRGGAAQRNSWKGPSTA